MTASRILRWPILLSCCLGLGYPITGCSSSETTASGGSRRSQTLAVATTAVTARDLARSVTVTGALEPIRTVSVNSQITATLLNVLVEEGSRVRTGQLLAELDARESAAQLARARAVLVNAEAAYERARRLHGFRVRDRRVALGVRHRARRRRAVAHARGLQPHHAPVAGVVTVKRVERGSAVATNRPCSRSPTTPSWWCACRSPNWTWSTSCRQPATVSWTRIPTARLAGTHPAHLPERRPDSRLVPVEVALESVPAGIAAGRASWRASSSPSIDAIRRAGRPGDGRRRQRQGASSTWSRPTRWPVGARDHGADHRGLDRGQLRAAPGDARGGAPATVNLRPGATVRVSLGGRSRRCAMSGQPARSLVSLAIRRPIGVLATSSVVVVIGLFFAGQLPLDLLPQIIYPQVRASVSYPGVAPEVMEEQVTKILETNLATTEGLISSSRVRPPRAQRPRSALQLRHRHQLRAAGRVEEPGPRARAPADRRESADHPQVRPVADPRLRSGLQLAHARPGRSAQLGRTCAAAAAADDRGRRLGRRVGRPDPRDPRDPRPGAAAFVRADVSPTC
jgi:pyruvate/2-oxoglutarate dehydrogenase complex dihydrolipoamide acyltransferase (E2) component